MAEAVTVTSASVESGRSSGLARRKPRGFRDQLGPSGQEEPLVGPLNALRPTRRDDFDVPRGAAELNNADRRPTRAGAGGLRRAVSSLPDQNPDSVGRFHRRQLHVGTIGKM